MIFYILVGDEEHSNISSLTGDKKNSNNEIRDGQIYSNYMERKILIDPVNRLFLFSYIEN